MFNLLVIHQWIGTHLLLSIFFSLTLSFSHRLSFSVCVCVFLCSLFSSFIYFLPFVSLRFFLISLEFVKFKRAHLPQTDTMNTVCSVCVSECVYIVITELMRNFFLLLFRSQMKINHRNRSSRRRATKQQQSTNETNNNNNNSNRDFGGSRSLSSNWHSFSGVVFFFRCQILG